VKNDFKLALQKAAAGVFEELTFMLPSRDLDDVQFQAAFQMGASVDFVGPLSGTFVVALFGDLVPIMAANMLGEMDAPTDFQQRDALKELANVICGNMLPHLLGEKVVYDISAPMILEDWAQIGSRHGISTERLLLGMERGRAELQLYLIGGQALPETQA
jgi:CheY-specific phosphatase CheX